MRISYPPEADAYRAEIQALLAATLPADWEGIGRLEGAEYETFLSSWRQTLYDHSLLAPAWPKEYGGGGLSPVEQVVLAEELALAGLPSGSPNDEYGIDMLGNTLLHFGSDEQKEYFLPRILSGEMVWCQGFSEPNAGSDLAAISTRARVDGDEWIIDGQKIWTSDIAGANWIFLLARTNPQAAKHHGITFLLAPLDQPGIDVRPIRMATGVEGFAEVFFDSARASAAHVVGEVDQGWSVALHLLGHERGQPAIVLPIAFKDELNRLVALAREHGRDSDPLIRDRLAACSVKVEVMRGLGWRAITHWLRGETPGAESSIFKLHWSEYHAESTQLAIDILGDRMLAVEGRSPQGEGAVCDEMGAPNSVASWQGIAIQCLGQTIYAGTSEIHRSIIGERMLGLPREPRPTAG